MTLFRELERSLCSLVKNERFALPNQRNFSGFRVQQGGVVAVWRITHCTPNTSATTATTSSRVIGQINLPYRQGKLHGNSPRHPPNFTAIFCGKSRRANDNFEKIV